MLAISVLLAHAGIWRITGNQLVNGTIAVQCFFVVSGFYMALILNEKYSEIGPYLANRALRIFPIYWAVLVMTTAAQSLFLNHNWLSDLLKSTDAAPQTKAFIIISSVFIFGTDLIVFLYQGSDGLRWTSEFFRHTSPPLWTLPPIPQAWSLPLEMYYYILAPWLVRSPWRLIAVAFASTAARFAFYANFVSHDPWSYRFFPFEIGLFALGGLGYHVYRKNKERLKPNVGRVLLAALLGAAALGTWPPEDDARRLMYVLAVGLSLPAIFAYSRSSRVDSYIGELSYPIYLVHLLVISLYDRIPHFGLDRVNGILLWSVALAIGLNAFVQRPIEARLKFRVSTKGEMRASTRLPA